jgi:hypothetical protein
MIIIPDTAFEHAKAVEAKAEFVEEPVVSTILSALVCSIMLRI